MHVGLDEARKRNEAATTTQDAVRQAQDTQRELELVDYRAFVAEIEPLALRFSAALKRHKLVRKWRSRCRGERNAQYDEQRNRLSIVKRLRFEKGTFTSRHEFDDIIFEDRGGQGALATFRIAPFGVRLEVCVDGSLPWRAYHFEESQSDRALPTDGNATYAFATNAEDPRGEALHSWRHLRHEGLERENIELIEQVIAATLDMFGIPYSEVQI